MLEIIVLGLVLVISNVVSALIVMKVMTSERVLKKYMTMATNMSVEMSKEIYQKLEEEDL